MVQHRFTTLLFSMLYGAEMLEYGHEPTLCWREEEGVGE